MKSIGTVIKECQEFKKNKIKLLEQWREVDEQAVCNKKKTCVDFVLAVRLKRGFVPG